MPSGRGVFHCRSKFTVSIFGLAFPVRGVRNSNQFSFRALCVELMIRSCKVVEKAYIDFSYPRIFLISKSIFSLLLLGSIKAA